MQLAVAPVFHRYEDMPGVAQNKLDVPWQMALLPFIVPLGFAFTVRVRLVVAVQPDAFVTVTV